MTSQKKHSDSQGRDFTKLPLDIQECMEKAGVPLDGDQFMVLAGWLLTDQSLSCTLAPSDITKEALLGGKGILYRTLADANVKKSIECKELQERVKTLTAGIKDIESYLNDSGLCMEETLTAITDAIKRLGEV